jgi:hypothetical protein
VSEDQQSARHVAHRGRCLALAGAVLACLAAPAPAGAHLRSGTVAVDYRASIRRSDTPAYTAQIFQSDRALGLTLKHGHTVVLLGYLGEPVFRLDAAGLAVNAASPTAAVDRLVTRAQRVVGSTPRWRLRPGRRSLVWHDARAQGLPPGVAGGGWSVPLIVDGRRTRLQGELQRFPAPSLWPWVALLAGVLAGAALPLLPGRGRAVHAGAIVLAVVSFTASVVLAVAFALDAYASPGTWIESVDGIVFLAVALGVLLRGPRHWQFGAAIGLGLLGLGIGLSKGAVFLHPIALAILPATIIRYAAVAAIGAGGGATALGCALYANTAEEVAGRDRASTTAGQWVADRGDARA